MIEKLPINFSLWKYRDKILLRNLKIGRGITLFNEDPQTECFIIFLWAVSTRMTYSNRLYFDLTYFDLIPHPDRSFAHLMFTFFLLLFLRLAHYFNASSAYLAYYIYTYYIYIFVFSLAYYIYASQYR